MKSVKHRYLTVRNHELPACICEVSQLQDTLAEFVGYGSEPMSPITITETWMTDAEFDAMPEWEP